MLNQLKQLKEDALNGCVKYPCDGICFNIRGRISNQYFEGWSGFSGDYCFPVFDEFDTVNKTPERQFNEYIDLWQGRQLELRLDLLDHLIACYEREVAQC